MASKSSRKKRKFEELFDKRRLEELFGGAENINLGDAAVKDFLQHLSGFDSMKAKDKAFVLAYFSGLLAGAAGVLYLQKE